MSDTPWTTRSPKPTTTKPAASVNSSAGSTMHNMSTAITTNTNLRETIALASAIIAGVVIITLFGPAGVIFGGAQAAAWSLKQRS